MITKQRAFEILINIILHNLQHQDYKRTVELGNKYRALITGEGIGEYLQQFNMRESDEMFEQREVITQVVTPSMCNTLMTPASKIPGVKPIINEAKFITKNSESIKELQKKLDEAIKMFYGDQSVDFYLAEKFLPLTFTDPNAFILTTFTNFDNRFEKAQVFATEIDCENICDFEFLNNILQYLVIRMTVQYALLNNEGSKEGKYYQMHVDNDQIEFTQIDVRTLKGRKPKNVLFDDTLQEVNIAKVTIGKEYYYLFDDKRLFVVKFWEPKSKRVPAFRVGCKPDIYTKGRTCVNLFHPAMPWLMKSLKSCSELDLSSSLCAFPQKLEYMPKCIGTDSKPCKGGYEPGGEKCSICHGSGLLDITSAQEAISLALPSDPAKMFDLQKLVVYVNLPIDILKWLDEYVDKEGRQALKAMYCSDIYTKDTVAQTATAKNIDMQSVYDALKPLGNKYCFARMYLIYLLATYLDIDKTAKLELTYVYPENYGFETIPDLIANMSAAKTAGASETIMSEFNNDILTIQFSDRPKLLKQLNVQELFNPFAGKSETERTLIISNNICTRFDKVLWSQKSRIFRELEEQFKDGVVGFYEMDYTKQLKLITDKVTDLITTIDDETPAPNFGAAFLDQNPANPKPAGQPPVV